jgi:hypothetical protein
MRINSANNISQIPIIPVVNFTQNEKHPEFFDITFPEIELFQEYSSLEIDIEVYPLTIDLNTKQYSIDPYEAYNKDDKIRYKKMYDTYALAFALFV